MESRKVIENHDCACPYKKVDTFICFLLKLNFQWQFLLRPLLLVLCLIKDGAYFVDLGNKMICMWIVVLVPLAAIFKKLYTGDARVGRTKGRAHWGSKDPSCDAQLELSEKVPWKMNYIVNVWSHHFILKKSRALFTKHPYDSRYRKLLLRNSGTIVYGTLKSYTPHMAR